MPLQNRVNPYGKIISSESRGTWMGNRGVLHKSQKLHSNFRTLNWIICKLEFHGIRRKVMTDGRYTELFFLDEATAYAAGHRPCAECRGDAFKKFKNAWLAANNKTYKLADLSVKNIDKIMHEERIDKNGNKITYKEQLQNLPNGVFIKLAESDDCYLYYHQQLLKWTAFGYTSILLSFSDKTVGVLTPKSIVNMFRLGYEIDVHISAKELITNNYNM